MGSICRLCLHKNESDSMKNIFEFSPKYFELNLTEILYWIFDVEIVVEDSYSKLICYKCLNVIESIGRYRKFFQVNQTFLHERRCPDDYEVKSGWYNTTDIGTNTEPQNSNYIKISLKDLNAFRSPQVNILRLEESKPLQKNNIRKPLVKQTKAVLQDVEKVKYKTSQGYINVPSNIFEEFRMSRPSNVQNKINAAHNRVDVPLSMFDCALPNVSLPNIKDECLNEGYVKVGDIYYKPNKDIPFVKLQKIECDKLFLKRYKKIGKYTFKKISRLSTTVEHIRLQKKKLISEYYYRMPTSALRELITETKPRKNKNDISINSLVKTNEIHVHVCEYCSKVFKHKHNLSEHCLKVHQQLLKRKYIKSGKYSLKKSYINEDSHSATSLIQNNGDLGCPDPLETFNCGDNNTFKIDNAMKSDVNNISEREQESSLVITSEITDVHLEEIITNSKEYEKLNSSDPSSSFGESNLSSFINSNDLSGIETSPDNGEIERDPLDISSDCLKMENNSNTETHSSTWLRVKDLRKLQGIDNHGNVEGPESTKITNNDFHMDYLKTVIFGEYSEINPKITYHNDSSCNIQDHSYSSNFENDSSITTVTKSTSKHTRRKLSRERMASDIANIIRKRFADIKKTRKKLENMKKIQFALSNEIDNCNIQSSLKALQEKLQMTEQI